MILQNETADAKAGRLKIAAETYRVTTTRVPTLTRL